MAQFEEMIEDVKTGCKARGRFFASVLTLVERLELALKCQHCGTKRKFDSFTGEIYCTNGECPGQKEQPAISNSPG